MNLFSDKRRVDIRTLPARILNAKHMREYLQRALLGRPWRSLAVQL